jgi:hypothetical protein
MGTRHLYWILTGPLFAVYLVSATWVAAVVVSAHQLQVLNRFDLVLVVPGDTREPCAQIIRCNFRDKSEISSSHKAGHIFFYFFQKKRFIENSKTSIFLFTLEKPYDFRKQ